MSDLLFASRRKALPVRVPNPGPLERDANPETNSSTSNGAFSTKQIALITLSDTSHGAMWRTYLEMVERYRGIFDKPSQETETGSLCRCSCRYHFPDRASSVSSDLPTVPTTLLLRLLVELVLTLLHRAGRRIP